NGDDGLAIDAVDEVAGAQRRYRTIADRRGDGCIRGRADRTVTLTPLPDAAFTNDFKVAIRAARSPGRATRRTGLWPCRPASGAWRGAIPFWWTDHSAARVAGSSLALTAPAACPVPVPAGDGRIRARRRVRGRRRQAGSG